MKQNFDFIAPVYDRLARLVFGRSIVNSQLFFLGNIQDHASVLVLGGGTGWLLEELIARKPFCSVSYVEASSKMLRLTQRRKLNDKTTLIHGTEDDIPRDHRYDVVITNFYFDLFPENKLNNVVGKISQHTKATSIWMAADFINEKKWWQRAMLKIMYVFFRHVAGIEAMVLPSWEKNMLQHQWVEQQSRTYCAGFIKSKLFIRGDVI